MQKKYEPIVHTDSNGYTYQTITNDENGVRIYQLKNGLKIYLAQNFDAPKIQTYIPVKTGSNNDPSDNTGLSHYLEHMMFKGTSKIGTTNWPEEKKLLNEIEELYEIHKLEENPEKKKEIYKKIDEKSNLASQFAIANEYDKCISSIGATGTNAHTWLDETVYKNNIPSNQLEKWLKIEKERFSEIVLRLFHTELESVYEEFNRDQDNDARLVNYTLMKLLFPTHPNGQQTTLGKAEHLKNPSMKAIYKYFKDIYVPNNYALVLVGDLDFDSSILLIDKYFGGFEYSELPKKEKITEKPINKIIRKTIFSPTISRVQLAWRSDSYGSREAYILEIIAQLLSNRNEAGLLDINLNQKQKVLFSQAYSVAFKEYGYFSTVAVPKENQTLSDVEKLILQEIEKIKTGNFPEWMVAAIVNEFKIKRLKSWETADGLATSIYDSFIKNRNWEQELESIQVYESITKEEIVEFSRKFFQENFVVVYKEQGTNENLIRVENPNITPIKINRESQSDFLKELLCEKTPDLVPQFIDYLNEIKTHKIFGRKLSFVRNKYNSLAQVHFIFPFGSDHFKELFLATQALQFFGTNSYSPEELKQEFFKLGISHDFHTQSNEFLISISGLEENIVKGIELLIHWLTEVKPNQSIFRNLVQTILESRSAAKKDKNTIMNNLVNYARFGKNSRTTDVLSTQELNDMSANLLMETLRNCLQMPYQVFYYGNDFDHFTNTINSTMIPISKEIPNPKHFTEPETNGKVYFIDYDMVQMEMSRIARAEKVNINNFGTINVYNEYFGRGLSSIVFQEMRESKSLAYSAFVSYQTHHLLNHHNYIKTYIGTQPDKLKVAVDTLQELIENFPLNKLQFENAKHSVLSQIANSRINRTNIFFNFLKLNKIGIDYDYRKNMYQEIQNLTLESLNSFHEKKVKSLQFNTAIIGKKENLDTKAIEKLGEFIELSLEDIFGY